MSITIFNTEFAVGKLTKLAVMSLVAGGMYLGHDAYTQSKVMSAVEEALKSGFPRSAEKLSKELSPGQVEKVMERIKVLRAEKDLRQLDLYLQANYTSHAFDELAKIQESGILSEEELGGYQRKLSSAARRELENANNVQFAQGLMKSYSSRGILNKEDQNRLAEYFSSYEKNEHYAELEDAIREGNFFESQTLLNEFYSQGMVSKEKYTTYKAKIDREHNQYRKYVLEEYIANGNHSQANALFAQLEKEGAFPPETLARYQAKMYPFSLEGLLEDITKSDGQDKIAAIDKVRENYPDYEGFAELDKTQLDAYVTTAINQFLSITSPEKTVEHLAEFYQWVSKQEKTVVEGYDFSQFFSRGHTYAESLSLLEPKKEYVVGDQITIKRNLGPEKGYSKDEFFYRRGATINDVPIGSKAIIISIADHTYRVYCRECSSYSDEFLLVKREFHDDNPLYHSAVSQHLMALEDHFIALGGKVK